MAIVSEDEATRLDINLAGYTRLRKQEKSDMRKDTRLDATSSVFMVALI